MASASDYVGHFDRLQFSRKDFLEIDLINIQQILRPF